MGNPLTITLSEIQAAADAIRGQVVRTPLTLSQTLSELTGAEVWLKFENMQFTASFKERGALNAMLRLRPEQMRQGVITMSAGIHAQAVAYHAQRLGIPATIVMPVTTPFVKVKSTEAYGATGHRVTSAAELPELMAKALASPGVQLIEVPMDYSDNDLILNRQIKELSAAI